LAVGMGDDIAVMIDDQGLAGLADPQLRQKFGYAADFDIDADNAANSPGGIPNRRSQGNSRLLRREEDIWIGPDRCQGPFSPRIPSADPGIEFIRRIDIAFRQ